MKQKSGREEAETNATVQSKYQIIELKIDDKVKNIK